MKPRHKTTALGILGSAFLLVVFASVRNTGSDPRTTLLVSESLLTRQSIKLDHLVFISRFPHWWAGHSYGARFMTDILPGLFLLTLFSWPTTTKGVGAKTATGIVALASIFAIGIHSGQGLFIKYTAAWNYQPNIDTYPEYLFDGYWPWP